MPFYRWQLERFVDPTFVARLYRGVVRTKYETGEWRPVMRGWLHLAVCPLWYAVWVSTYLFWRQTQGVRVMLSMKVWSYFFSAMFHCLDTRGWDGMHDFLFSADVVFIAGSIIAPSIPIAELEGELFMNVVGMIAVMVGVAYTFDPQECSHRFTWDLLGILYTTTILSIGWSMSFPVGWFVATFFYTVGFLLPDACPLWDGRYVRPRFPWHLPGAWGYHEDFHACIVVADTVLCALVIWFVNHAKA